MPIIKKPTSKDFYNSVKDKDSYYWRTSGIHTYNVLLKNEIKELEQSKKKRR